MTPDGRRMVAWTGAGAAILVAGFGWIAIRASGSSETAASAETLHASYVKYYHPDKPEGLAVDKAQAELRDIAKAQAEELQTADGQLTPAMPSTYLVESLSEAATQVTADYTALRQLSARSKIPIPAALPYEGGLDADGKARARQLGNLALIRQAVQTCLHANVAKVAAVNPGQAFASPGSDYAVFTCDLDLEGDWASAARLLGAFAQPDGRGLGLRNLEATGGTDKPLRLRITASMTTLNREGWGLGAVPAAQDAAPAGSTPAAGSSEGGSRLRRLSGARP
jgi:hypothetical protein